jgi:mycofactocin precursor
MTQPLDPQTSTEDTVSDLDAGGLVAEDLIEEVSIDGMCGVY